ncbi:EF-hand calcium-binding domain-containing protein 4B isoform X2 [Girardinichthys multiradiatus]|uniref:EF-hand calcium-binding domain-containing protein 4B isoform X2 n=1 Tax=Girardinichthys multiradiatus TaxID=208333 RepID=UPI001FACACAB|nr:EF-hand calcium-binding domain-containing protein 4B isoform X2 [Girardinichthys multiradiatus]
MAAFTAPCPDINTAGCSMAQITCQRKGSSDNLRARDSDLKRSGSSDDGQNTILEKTHEFFQMCDIENKGFITRRDMQRLNGELPLSAEELENVFDMLDSDGNGFLTLEEFSSGFSGFLFGRRISVDDVMGEKNLSKSLPEVLYQSQWEEGPGRRGEDDEEKHFAMLMESLGASSILEKKAKEVRVDGNMDGAKSRTILEENLLEAAEDLRLRWSPAEVRTLWAKLRRDEPHLLSNFEHFLARVTAQIREANQEKREMESALKRKAATHDDEIQHLYEEMEQQIKSEKDKIVLQDYERFLSRSKDLELQLSSKETELEQLFQKQRRLEGQCQELHSEQHVTKVENVKLKQTNDDLARELELVSQELTLAQEQLSLLQEQSTRLHEEKEMEIYRLTEGLQRERASLLKQLDLLREMNKHLRDERDMSFQKPKSTKQTLKQRSLIDGVKQTSTDVFKSEDKEELTSTALRQTLVNGLYQPSISAEASGRFQRIISIEEDHLPYLLIESQTENALQEFAEGERGSGSEDGVDMMSAVYGRSSPLQLQQSEESVEERQIPSSPRGQPVGKETSINEEGVLSAPDRLFKIVLVGNSSVGKTSLLQRFCDDRFHPGTCATVGIDYSVKTITVDNSQVALQMWDTAGQERYRSITKQFFRKADGVIVMYDITAEQSFTAVRQWMTSVKEGTGEDIPIMLLGNKTDKEAEREVQKEVGERLAKDCQMTFFECSACSGYNVAESMVHLARILKEQEDQEKEKTVQLIRSPSKKRSCC